METQTQHTPVPLDPCGCLTWKHEKCPRGHTRLPWKVGSTGRCIFGPPNANPYPKTIASSLNKPNAEYIVRAVNAHESLIEDLAICLQSFGKDMQNDFRRRVEGHLKEVITNAEAK